MRKVTVAATQMACSWDAEANVERAMQLVREAAGRGANIVLIQELFETPYFPAEEREERFALARSADGHPTIGKMAALAKELEVVLPVSFFERAGNAHFNSLAIVDADGSMLGVYRKSHIPDGPGYEEKYYFNPGNTGFRVWKTRYGNVGAAICWDQWFPECARAMALLDAELLLYPTAIGDEPLPHYVDSRDQWQLVMQGHAAKGQPYNTAAMIRCAQENPEHPSQGSFAGNLAERSRGSIEAKLVNVTAVLHDLGRDDVSMTEHGYRPLSNYQSDLKAMVVGLLAVRDEAVAGGFQVPAA